jgi:hypothetical protein
MPEADATFTEAGNFPTLDNRHWVLDAPRAFPIQYMLIGFPASIVGMPIFNFGAASPSAQFFGQLPAGTGVDATVTSVAPGMREGQRELSNSRLLCDL